MEHLLHARQWGRLWLGAQAGAEIDGEAVDDYSGYSVSLSGDGQAVAIGASDNDGAGPATCASTALSSE